jgi:hypothetical protein
MKTKNVVGPKGANARLIAAAPEMYDALEAFILGVGEPWDRVAKAKAALAKARGDSQ